jgi:hypothetical protein
MPESDPPAKVATSDGLGPDPEAVRLVEYLKGYPRSDGIDAAILLLSEQASDIACLQALLKLQKSSYEREIEIEVAAERERCAKLCDPTNADRPEDWTEYAKTRAECAARIRVA